jgi:hypothetical protein
MGGSNIGSMQWQVDALVQICLLPLHIAKAQGVRCV